MAQMSFYAGFATSECYLVAAMAYDRHAAICNPPLYSIAMSPEVCASLIVGSYSAGFLSSLIHMSCIFSLKFCGAHVVTHFFCDGPPILSPSRVDTWLCEILLFIFAGFNLVSCTLTILVSYLFILITILRRNSAQGRFKAVSTCASHFAAVCLFYGTTLHVPAPQVQPLPDPRPHGCCDLHSGDPNAEPSYLLSEKQGCERSFKKGLGKENNGMIFSVHHHIALEN